MNLKKLTLMTTPICEIKAINSSNRGLISKSDNFGGMENLIYMSNDCHITLTTNLYYAKQGLCNGTFGIIKDIIYQNNNSKNCLPETIIIYFPKYNGPQFFSEANLKNCLPIPPSILYSKEVSATRKSFPIRLAYAITNHKTQGETLEKGIIHLGKNEKNLGTSFVQFSRFKKLTDFLVEPFSYDRLTIIANSESR